MNCSWPQGLLALVSMACASAMPPEPVRAALPHTRANPIAGAPSASPSSKRSLERSAHATAALQTHGDAVQYRESDTALGPRKDEKRAPSAAALDTSIFFATLPVSADATLPASQLRLMLRVKSGPFGELTRRGLAANVQDGSLLVQVPEAYPTSHDHVNARHRACSHVVDCDSASVATLGKGQLATKPSVRELVSFVARYVSSKSLSRGFDVASEVAARAEGDCSEHAVLLTALARRYRYSARVVFGLAMLRFDARLPLLVGHAWTEIYDRDHWQVADAALEGLRHDSMPGFLQLHYLPVSVLEHEGVGFLAKLLSVPGLFSIEQAASAEPSN